MRAEKPDQIIQVLRSAGYDSYYVGGCVRDHLLDRPIHDWDITTAALPTQIMACFEHCVPTGVKHGTVTVLLDGMSAEVTTFRTEGSYSDGRHPDRVKFVGTLQEDLARRDFTVNAMAMDPDGNIVDLFGGREDLERKLLRCVGDPNLRFREDALRMLRALRFSAQLGFEVEARTRKAIACCASLCRGLSAERVRDEMEKTLLSDNPEKIGEMAELGLLDDYGSVCGLRYGLFETLPKDRLVRWAGLCRIWPQLDLIKLRLDKRSAMDAMAAGRCLVPETELEWKRLIAKEGAVRAGITATLCGASAEIEALLSSGVCLSLRDLAVKGSELSELHGADVGRMLQTLLDHVLQYPEDNKKEELLKIYKNRIDYCY